MRIQIPPIDVAPIDPQTGQWTADYYDIIKGLERLGLLDLADVTRTAPGRHQHRALECSARQIHLRGLIGGCYRKYLHGPVQH
jgi:hypothetical protein